MMRLKNLLMFSLIALLGTTPLAFGQSAPLAEKQKAVLMFDFQMSRFLESELAKQLGLKDMISQQAIGSVSPTKILRVYGMASAPESVSELQQFRGGTFPVEFSVRVQFADADVMKEALESMAKDSTTVQKNGKTYYRPKGDNAPDNVCAGPVDSTTMIVGTDAYVALADPKVAVSEGLRSSWKTVSAGDDAIRLAIDLDGARDMINEAIEMGKQNADPMSQGFMDLIPSMKDVRLTLDVTGANLMTFGSNCVDSEKANDLKGALDGVFAIAKMGAGAQIKALKENPEMAELGAVAEKLVKSLGAKVDGNNVQITIPKPEGFEAAAAQAAKVIPMMMMGGGGPPQSIQPSDDNEDF